MVHAAHHVGVLRPLEHEPLDRREERLEAAAVAVFKGIDVRIETKTGRGEIVTCHQAVDTTLENSTQRLLDLIAPSSQPYLCLRQQNTVNCQRLQDLL